MGTLYKERSLVVNDKPLFTWQLEAKQMWKKEIKDLSVKIEVKTLGVTCQTSDISNKLVSLDSEFFVKFVVWDTQKNQPITSGLAIISATHMSPPKYKYNPTTHYMLEFPSPNWVLVSNSKLTSAAQDVVFFFPIFWFWKFGNFSKFLLLKIQKIPNTFVITLPNSAQIKLVQKCLSVTWFFFSILWCQNFGECFHIF